MLFAVTAFHHQLMTHLWLSKHAEISAYTVGNDYLEIHASDSSYRRATKVQLLPPDTLSMEDNVTVTIIIGMDTVLAHSKYHDPIFGISDDNSFIGFVKLASADPYRVTSSCYRAEGRSTDDRLTEVSTTYPDVFRLPTSGLALCILTQLRDGVPATQMENILTGI